VDETTAGAEILFSALAEIQTNSDGTSCTVVDRKQVQSVDLTTGKVTILTGNGAGCDSGSGGGGGGGGGRGYSWVDGAGSVATFDRPAGVATLPNGTACDDCQTSFCVYFTPFAGSFPPFALLGVCCLDTFRCVDVLAADNDIGWKVIICTACLPQAAVCEYWRGGIRTVSPAGATATLCGMDGSYGTCVPTITYRVNVGFIKFELFLWATRTHSHTHTHPGAHTHIHKHVGLCSAN
jgi:hypothetical protein